MKTVIKRSALQHGLTESEILYAVDNQIKSKRYFNKQYQTSNIWAICILANGNSCEIVYAYDGIDRRIVFHAMSPARKNFIQSVERKENGIC